MGLELVPIVRGHPVSFADGLEDRSEKDGFPDFGLSDWNSRIALVEMRTLAAVCLG